jgi:beta-galactosidase
MTFHVDVYSACDAVELFLNDRSLGIHASGDAEKRIAAFDVPYAPGMLKAVGYRGAEKAAEVLLSTAGKQTRIRLSADRAALEAAAGSLCYVTAEVIDDSGCLDPNAGNQLTFTVSGDGTLAAVGSADPVSTESYRGSQRSVFRGRCLVVVQSNGAAGEIHLRAEADGLEPTELLIPVGDPCGALQ